ncbi:hypothetical protein D9758_008194 [Tetrapyrgos nigripes]|uniref:Uncharacterized protein n=1 Tax=Tetrapyrgos nigripes TaxID=182062 RepID=A0A8H5LPU8_9AGAR|nr:hypothetical protein D9758_018693 [Tetrapyrgos nigripes]KAF5364986.1 hypothetical protein D9758_008194 [Tetrapyrgos nigripes]
MAADIVKGGWSQEEDECLIKAIEKYGTKWSMVSSMVKTRNSDQCAKRWTDTLNPSIDRTSWTLEEDALLLKAVQEQGNVWTKIVKTYFPGRTGLAAKNRYNSIIRFTTDSRVARRKTSSTRKPRRISDPPSTLSESVASPSTSESSLFPDEPSPTPSGISTPSPLSPCELSPDLNSLWPPSNDVATEKPAQEQLFPSLQNEQYGIVQSQSSVLPQFDPSAVSFATSSTCNFLSQDWVSDASPLQDPFFPNTPYSHDFVDSMLQNSGSEWQNHGNLTAMSGHVDSGTYMNSEFPSTDQNALLSLLPPNLKDSVDGMTTIVHSPTSLCQPQSFDGQIRASMHSLLSDAKGALGPRHKQDQSHVLASLLNRMENESGRTPICIILM